jgi:predicted nucleic acid-binding Zn ribbon protein
VKRRRDEPRSLADAVRSLRTEASPQTPLAAAQAVWERAMGPAVAAQASPVSERDGVLTVACRSATWAQELDLMQVELLEKLRTALAETGSEPAVAALRFTADAARHSDSG